jgi:hypothetical protein
MKGMIYMFDNFELPNETVDKAYDDIAHPAASEAGKFIGRIPRAINAALSGIDKWIMQKEYNLSETERLLAQKMKNTEPQNIVPPEPYVAIPALQSISYCFNNEELRNLYANLLANAMTAANKNNVHPAFVEIIKQFSPNDALVLKEIFNRTHTAPLPCAKLSIVLKIKGLHIAGQLPKRKIYSDIITDLCQHQLTHKQLSVSLENLNRLGLITFSDIILEDTLYDFVKTSYMYSVVSSDFDSLKGTDEEPEYIDIDKLCLYITDLGELFCNICIKDFDS